MRTPGRGRVRRGLRRGAYLLPSLFTLGNIFLGFYAVVQGARENFQRAAVLIFAAVILDGLDGRIARLTGTQSEFGKEYDSLADVVTFGVAPALLAYFWGLEEVGRVGWLVPLFFLVCAATRLARYNVQVRVVSSRYFVGLPAPAAGAAVASVLFFAPDRGAWPAWAEAWLLVSMVFLGLLMVSTFRYPSFKQLDQRRRQSYRVLLPMAAVVLLVAYFLLSYPAVFFLAVSGTYAVSGPLLWVRGRVRPKEPAPSLQQGEVD